MNRVRNLGCALALLAVAGSARAEAPAQDPVNYDFDDEIVKGDLVRPDVEILESRRRGTRGSLIEVRAHYLAELLKSVEDL